MRRRLKRILTGDLVRREARGLLRLGPWAISSLILLALIWQAGLPTTMGLFQSPVTPEPPTPTTVSTQIPTQTLEPAVPTATQIPTGLPTESLTVTAEPSATMPATLTPVTATLTPMTATSTPTPAEATPTATSLPTNTPVPSPTVPAEQDRYSDEESNLRFEWGMLVDSAALALSYTWLCCGVLIVLAIPVVFAVLWVASKRREQAED